MNRKAGRISTLSGIAAIVTLAGMACLAGCAGVSTSASTATKTGSGPPPPSTHTVNLSWAASTSTDVAGYSVYRALYTNSCGQFSKINSALVVATFYTDSQVADGQSYCYATTAVSLTNQESSFSNVATDIQIPSS